VITLLIKTLVCKGNNMGLKRSFAAFTLTLLRSAIRLIGPAPAAYLAERLPLTFRVELPGGSLTFLSGNSTLLFRARSVLHKEPETIVWIDSFAQGCCLWDIGANVGVYSLYAAHRKVAVLAFEPAAANYHVLNHNIELNAAHGLVQAYCLAFAQENQLGTLNMANTMAGGATNNFDAEGKLSPYAKQTGMVFNQGMLGLSIDRFVEMFDPPFPDHMKIDVDGIEEQILQGASKTLADPRLRSVLIELETIEPESYQRCLDMFETAGFELKEKGVLQSLGSSMRLMNHIFARKELP
jgi:FkbM family methyltransferase